MGRRAKYLTQADRQAARREQKARYAQSDLGKSTRAAAQLRAQERAVHAQEALAGTIDIPAAMRAYATHPFCMSWAFRDATGPALGLQKAPFTFRLPDSRSLRSLECRGSKDPLRVKLHTLQFTWAIEAADARRTEWLVSSTEDVIELAEAELKAWIRGWMQMETRTVLAGMEAEIWEVAMCWGARRTIMLAEDLELRRQG
ncbi:hypothetical protein OH76DRAFT_1300558, partial [Lentinus brumalis]